MNGETVQSTDALPGASVCIPVPIPDPGVFNHDATGDVLHVLFDTPETTFSNRELHRLTGKGLGNVNAAVRALESLGVVRVDRNGRANRVRINSARMNSPEDPVTAIPQADYHEPVRAILDAIADRFGGDAGVVLFGSVARGDADRASDIDLFVVVEDDRMTAQRTAHEIEDDIAAERFDGDRYESHIVVETRDAAPTHDRIRTVLTGGLTLRNTPALDAVKTAVFS